MGRRALACWFVLGFAAACGGDDGFDNVGPYVDDEAVTTAEDTPVAVDVLANDGDRDGDPLSLSRASAGEHVARIDGRRLVIEPRSNFHGQFDVVYTVSDGLHVAQGRVTVTVTPVNDAPVAWVQGLVTPRNTPVAFRLEGADVEGDALTFEIVSGPASGTISGTGADRTYTPSAGFVGWDTFTFRARDASLPSEPVSIGIDVRPTDQPPVAEAQTVTLAEDLPRTITLGATDPDTGTGALSFFIEDPPDHGTLTGVGNVRTYTPAANYHGADSFTFRVSDNAATSAPATVTLAVESVPDVPVATPQSMQTSEDVARPVTLAGTDGDGDSLTFAITTPPAHGTLVAGEGAAFTYTPTANYNGSDSFAFTASDLDHTSQPVTVPITVTPVADAPTLAGASITGAEGALIAIPLPTHDVDGQALTYLVSTAPAHGTIGGSGATRHYSTANHHGTDTFALVASDGTSSSAPATFTVTITPTPDAPVARDDVGVATPGQPLYLDVLANDEDVDGDELTIDSAAAPAHGSVEIDGDALVYTPATGAPAVDTFTYTIADPTGLTATATVTVGIGAFPGGLAPKQVGPVVAISAAAQLLQHDISDDGRYLALMSGDTLMPGDTNGVADVYLYDRVTDSFERVSVAHDGGLPDGASERPSLSADGRYVAFASAATNLVAGDTNGAVDVFVRDRVAGTTVRASVSAAGAQVSGTSRDPDLSADGQVVAFTSTAFQLVADDANGVTDVFVRDLAAGTTTRVSVRTGGGEADFQSVQPVVSGDGNIVAFTSAATNLVIGDGNNAADVFVHDRTTGTTERASVSSTGGEASNASQTPALSHDGRFVAFRSQAGNLVPGATNGTFVRDRQAITTTLGAPYLASSISLSADGRYLAAHLSDGSCLVRDRFAATIHFYSTTSGADVWHPLLSRNGKYVAMLSNITLVPGPSPSGTRLFLYANPFAP